VENVPFEPWMPEAIRLQPRACRVRYLVELQREQCIYCASGTRTVTIWATLTGRGEQVAWCAHCFNAECDHVELEVTHEQRFAQMAALAAQGKVSPRWEAARPAVADLERRGLI
jgi:hypothetical protein